MKDDSALAFFNEPVDAQGLGIAQDYFSVVKVCSSPQGSHFMNTCSRSAPSSATGRALPCTRYDIANTLLLSSC